MASRPAVASRRPVPFDRKVALERLATESFDLLVIGGGVTGCGVALDGAARGLRTALVEARDFASGTSSRSSKLVHGGLRYLQQHDYLLVHEALRERQLLLRNAPHLVHPLPFLIPLFGRDGRGRVSQRSVANAYSAALWLYDIAGGVRIGRLHRRISAEEAVSHFPRLRTDTLAASFLYWDAQADDARLTLAIARTAALHGATLANYCPVESLVEHDGRVIGARLAPPSGILVRATAVVNAAGVWADQVARLSPTSRTDAVAIRPAKGVHVAVRADRLPCDYASVLAVPGARRSVFVVPWSPEDGTEGTRPRRYTYIGTTDTDYDGPLGDPRCSREDIEYCLRAVNTWTSAGLTTEDVTGTWAGLRPLVDGDGDARTSDLSRRHRVTVGNNGLVSVTGGKLTTYRKMAADAVDAVLDGSPTAGGWTSVGRRAPYRVRPSARRPSPTAVLTLLGGDGGGDGRDRDAEAAATAGGLGLTTGDLTRLARRHGTGADQVIDLCRARPGLAEPLSASLPYLAAEVVHAARHEMALTVGDVLERRTRSRMLDRRAAVEAAPRVAELLGYELGWDREERLRQVDEFTADVEADLEAEKGGAPGVHRSAP